MSKSITPGQIKKTNRQRIYNYIYEHKSVSQQDLTYALRPSCPTVASNLAEMEEIGLIYKNGPDQMGRKAAAYSITADGATVVYGAIMGCTGLTTQAFSRYLPYLCSFVHELDAAALSELWSSPDLTDAIYLSLSRHLGGSMIVKRKIVSGKHGHTATFEHIQARPRGDLCYCGKRGCSLGDSDDYLLISKMPSHNITIGVALPYIQAFLEDIGCETGKA